MFNAGFYGTLMLKSLCSQKISRRLQKYMVSSMSRINIDCLGTSVLLYLSGNVFPFFGFFFLPSTDKETLENTRPRIWNFGKTRSSGTRKWLKELRLRLEMSEHKELERGYRMKTRSFQRASEWNKVKTDFAHITEHNLLLWFLRSSDH